VPTERDLEKLKEIAEDAEIVEEGAGLPEELVKLIESGEIPEEIVEQLASGELSVEDLMEALASPYPEELEEEIDEKVRKMGIFESTEKDFKALFLYSLAFFAEQSMHLSEEAMKTGDEYQINHYAKKTRIIRKLAQRTFGIYPEKDYYVGGYKEIRGLRGKIEHEERMEMAQFCAENVHLDEDLQANPKLLKKAFKKHLPSIKGIGLATKYRAFLKEKFVKYIKQDRPDKAGVIFELLTLFKIVESVYLSVKEQKVTDKKK